MDIGVDARNLVTEISGIGRYLLESVRCLIEGGHRVTLYCPSEPKNISMLPQSAIVHISSFYGPLSRVIWGNTTLPSLIKNARHEVFWGPAHRLPLLLASVPQVLTVHDLVWHHASSTMAPRGYLSEKLFFGASIKRADRIVAVSASTKKAVSMLFPSASSKVDVVYPGCTAFATGDSEPVLRRMTIDRPFALFVGTLEPRKNLLRLLEAFATLPDKIRESLLLVVAGGKGWGSTDLVREVNRLNLSANVRLVGYVSETDLSVLYKEAHFLAFPSIYEGFGFPIIEANSVGTPVLTSTNSSMPEVGGAAAMYVDPMDVNSIADGLLRLASDRELHYRLSDEAVSNASRFVWKHSASALADVFQRAAREFHTHA